MDIQQSPVDIKTLEGHTPGPWCWWDKYDFREHLNNQDWDSENLGKAFLMADNPDDLRCAQWVIANGSAKRRDGDE